MKSKLIKILILIITIILLFGTNQVFADAPYENPDYYKPDINNSNNISFKEKVNKIFGAISVVGTICSVVILVIIGLRYMLGTIEEKAEYKKTMIGYIIGVFLLFSATTLPSILYDIGQSIGEETTETEIGGRRRWKTNYSNYPYTVIIKKVKILVEKLRKIILIMVIIQSSFISISSAFSFEDIITQGNQFVNEGKDNQTYIYQYKIDEYGKTVVDENGNPIPILDENGNPIPILDENGNQIEILDERLLSKTVESVYNILLALGVAISVIAGAVLGIKFMAGSVEEQAKIKEMLIPYIIGCIVVFGSFGIWKIVMSLAGDIFI